MCSHTCSLAGSTNRTTLNVYTHLPKKLHKLSVEQITSYIIYAQLTLPQQKWGIGLPDLGKYQWACHPTRLIDWHAHDKAKDWVKLEASFSSIPLKAISWLTFHRPPSSMEDHPLNKKNITCFHKACDKTKVSSVIGPLTLVRMNPDFQPGMSPNFLAGEDLNNVLRAHPFFTAGKVLDLDHMAPQWPDARITPWIYIQLCRFFSIPGSTTHVLTTYHI